MGLFKNAGAKQEVRPTRSGAYFLPGVYVVRLERIAHVKSSDPRKKGAEFIVVETRIIESDNPELRPGQVATDFYDLAWPDLAAGNMAALLLAAHGSLAVLNDEEAPTDADFSSVEALDAAMDDALSDDSIVLGVYLKCTAWNKLREGKTPITLKKWEVPVNLLEIVAAQDTAASA